MKTFIATIMPVGTETVISSHVFEAKNQIEAFKKTKRLLTAFRKDEDLEDHEFHLSQLIKSYDHDPKK